MGFAFNDWVEVLILAPFMLVFYSSVNKNHSRIQQEEREWMPIPVQRVFPQAVSKVHDDAKSGCCTSLSIC
jgi:hypothetical protein